MHPRILAIDYGSKRVGVALSDPLGMMAQPLDFIAFSGREKFFADLKKIIEEKGVRLLLLGLPKNMDGSLGPKAQECLELSEALKKEFGLEVELADERLTTRQADNVMINELNLSREKRKGLRDSMAAAILLQAYLDSHKVS